MAFFKRITSETESKGKFVYVHSLTVGHCKCSHCEKVIKGSIVSCCITVNNITSI